MGKVFFSWQSDRSTNVCRNFIERSAQSAIDRLQSDHELEDAAREELAIDKDTQGIPGAAPIFDTIAKKIEQSAIFMPDLTFVGDRCSGRPNCNPNVLIEYGIALGKLGSERIIAVMNTSYGKPSPTSLPFNLAHTRFPIEYDLPENASDEVRQQQKKLLTSKIESALRMLITSGVMSNPGPKKPTAFAVAEQHRLRLDREAAVRQLRSTQARPQTRDAVRILFSLIQEKAETIAQTHGLDLECGHSTPAATQSAAACVLRRLPFGTVIRWDESESQNPKLVVEEYKGRLFLPGESLAGIPLQRPQQLGHRSYEVTLSPEDQIGWVKTMKAQADPAFVDHETLSDDILTDLMSRQES